MSFNKCINILKIFFLLKISSFSFAKDTRAIVEKNLFKVEYNNSVRSKRSLISLANPKWTDGKVFFIFDHTDSHSIAEKNIIRNAMKKIENEGNIKFIELTEKDLNTNPYPSYIIITNIVGSFEEGGGCYAPIGMHYGIGQVNLSSNYSVEDEEFSCLMTKKGFPIDGIIIHELLHVLGFEHEHSRADQMAYIKLHLRNARNICQSPEQAKNFAPLTDENHLIMDDYDYLSIMHYDSFACATKESRLNSKPVITKSNDDIILKNEKLSIQDKITLKRLYGANRDHVFLDSNANPVQYCVPYKIRFIEKSPYVISYLKKRHWNINGWDYIIKSEYQYSTIIIEPNEPSGCEKINQLKKYNLFHFDVEKNAPIFFRFNKPSYDKYNYLNISDGLTRYLYLDMKLEPIFLDEIAKSIQCLGSRMGWCYLEKNYFEESKIQFITLF
ncbi:M12 family metallopeptidase [Silvanigrella aquatica]|uniref:Peptidase M12A domain-containing protein n=1 Tax=Silvanigrella aquatica TaxID=1915309 RepID=A0A1L4CWV2_9BACT|nr:M12 family metallopeptidase [Silvanigrella aquatica]APJ02430.1 hypothetical protein AXG55_00145 [Silvanigrella aquatica]